MAKLHTLQAHGSGGLVSMRNTNTAAGRAAHAPGDDPLARALKELNSRALRVVGPSDHKCRIPRVCRVGVLLFAKSFVFAPLALSITWYSHMVQPPGDADRVAVRGFRPMQVRAQQTIGINAGTPA